jgi:hypothetical protein
LPAVSAGEGGVMGDEKRKAGWYVEIVEMATAKIEHAIGPMASLRGAERTERGANINLNHERFFTRIVEVHR